MAIDLSRPEFSDGISGNRGKPEEELLLFRQPCWPGIDFMVQVAGSHFFSAIRAVCRMLHALPWRDVNVARRYDDGGDGKEYSASIKAMQ